MWTVLFLGLIPLFLLINKMNSMDINEVIKEQRRLIIDVSYKARQGHLSSCMSILEMLNVLYRRIIKFDSQHPDAVYNDKVVLSKGHASLAIYTLLYQLGTLTKGQLYSFSQFDSILGEHPDRNKVPGVDVSTGSLGHGFPNAIGMAIGYKAQNMLNKVYAIIGDGEANEGSIWEAAFVADKMHLDNIICIVDDNNSASHVDNIGGKFEAFGWEVKSIDGNNIDELTQALSYKNTKPYLIWAHTVKGNGCPLMENDPEGWHHRVINESEYNQLMEGLK